MASNIPEGYNTEGRLSSSSENNLTFSGLYDDDDFDE